MESGAVVRRGGRLWLVLNGLSGAAPLSVGNGSGAVFHLVALAGDVDVSVRFWGLKPVPVRGRCR